MSMIRDALVEELQKGAKLSEEYLTKIKTAKTSTKKKYYQKKITGNNERNIKVVEAIQRLEASGSK